MKRSTVKEVFGGEVAFTKYISQDKTTCDNLLAAIDETRFDEYSVVAEDRTVDGKRADLVIREHDKVRAVIEAQDATGLLDSVHASKITYYMYEKDCNLGVLICEDADEHLKGYVRYINENTPFNIYLIYARVYDNKFVDFVTTMRPFSFLEKKIQRKAPVSTSEATLTTDNDSWRADFVTEKREQNLELFSGSNAINYLAKGKLGALNLVVAIHPKKGGLHTVEIYHAKKLTDNKVFEASVDRVAASVGEYKVWSNRDARRVKTNGWEDTLNMFNVLVAACESGEIIG